MGVKGLSKAVIKQVWRDGALGDLPEGTRIGVDAAGWLHKACVYNAQVGLGVGFFCVGRRFPETISTKVLADFLEISGKFCINFCRPESLIFIESAYCVLRYHGPYLTVLSNSGSHTQTTTN